MATPNEESGSQCGNITIFSKNFSQIAEDITWNATNGNIDLVSGQCVEMNGEDGGVCFMDYTNVPTTEASKKPIVFDSYFAKKNVTDNGTIVNFTKIDSLHPQKDNNETDLNYDSILGRTVYIVLETKNMDDISLDVVIKPGDTILTGNNGSLLELMHFNPSSLTYDAASLFSAKVGNFDALNNNSGSHSHYTNLESDHKNKVIIKLQLRPRAEVTFKEWGKKLGNQIAKLEILVGRTDQGPCTYGVGEMESSGGGPINYVGSDINKGAIFRIINKNTYEIYNANNSYNFLPLFQGDRIRIAKIDSFYINAGVRINNTNEVIYFYFDEYDNEYWICKCDKFSIPGKNNGAFVSNNFLQAIDFYESGTTPPPNSNLPTVNQTIDYLQYQAEGVDARKSYVFSQGIVTKGYNGGNYPDRYYSNQTNKIELIPTLFLPEIASLNSSTVQPALERRISETVLIKYGFMETRRRSANPDLFAAFLGALAQSSFEDIVLEGFSYEDGTCFPSVSHANGKAVDSNYLNTLTRENTFVQALWEYGIRFHGRGNSGWKVQIVHSSYLAGHEGHLHSGGATFNQDYIHDLYE